MQEHERQGWTDAVADVTRRALGEESAERLWARLPEAGRVVDAAAAGHLAEVRLVEKAVLQRARRDLAREMRADAAGGRASRARRRLADATGRAGLLRYQQDLTEQAAAQGPTTGEATERTSEREQGTAAR